MAERQDREGNTQEARGGAQEGPGRALDGPQRRRRPDRRAARALGVRPRRCSQRMAEATIAVLDAHRATRSVVERAGHRRRCSRRSARTSPLAAAPIALVCVVAGVVVNVAQVGLKPMPAALKPDFKKLNPLTGAKNIFGPQRARRDASRTSPRSSPSAASSRSPCFPKLDELAALSACRRRAAAARSPTRSSRIAQRAAARLPRHRRRRLRLPALAPREAAEDGQAGGQGRAQAAGAAGRGQGARSAAARWSSPARA